MELVFITSNPHKYEEVKSIALSFGISLQWKKIEYFEPQGDSTRDVALGSLGILAPIIQGDFVIEDAGLEIPALNGFPGVYSSYVFKTIGYEGILNLLHDTVKREAMFRSVVVGRVQGKVIITEAETPGEITLFPRGEQGFGFDPIFIPKGETMTFAEMNKDMKNQYSHRSKAFQAFFKQITDEAMNA